MAKYFPGKIMESTQFRVFAMDTYFYTTLGAYSWQARCEMLAELGYDGTYLTLWSEDAWDDLAKIGDAPAYFGLDVAGVYWTMDLDNRGGGYGRFHDALETVPSGTRFEIAIVGEADRFDVNDARFDERLLPLLEIAARRDLSLSLYPHIDFWLDSLPKATALAQRLNHPNLGVVFCGYHWYALDGQNLATQLKAAAPFLRSANLCGSSWRPRRTPKAQCTIETLDSGELDNFAVLGALRDVGFIGPMGFQGYGIGGDVYANLRRSLQAFRDMERRLQQHPQWAVLP
jgi:sugar phosphate isomerase/epimerase